MRTNPPYRTHISTSHQTHEDHVKWWYNNTYIENTGKRALSYNSQPSSLELLFCVFLLNFKFIAGLFTVMTEKDVGSRGIGVANDREPDRRTSTVSY